MVGILPWTAPGNWSYGRRRRARKVLTHLQRQRSRIRTSNGVIRGPFAWPDKLTESGHAPQLIASEAATTRANRADASETSSLITMVFMLDSPWMW